MWLILELFGYLALSPFPAVRRVLGLSVVSLLAAGHLACRNGRPVERRRLVAAVAVLAAALSAVLEGVDMVEARAQRDGIAAAARAIEAEGGGTVWYAGHWGLQHYAESHGMHPVNAFNTFAEGRIPVPPRTRFAAGDWLVLPDKRITRQPCEPHPTAMRHVFSIVVEDALPWQTVPCYYGGQCAIENHAAPRLVLAVYRATADHDADR